MIGALPVSKALALLQLPAEERETFAQANNVQDQSAEEIKRLIRERDEARQALERAKDKAQRDFNAMDRASCAKQARIYALEKELKSGDVLLTMGAGQAYKCADLYLLEEKKDKI